MAQSPAGGRVLWLRSNADTTTGISNLVEVWGDQSGVTGSLSQGKGQSRPWLELHSLAGEASLHFDGNDVLTRPNGMPANVYTLVMVVALDGYGGSNTVLGGGPQLRFDSIGRPRLLHGGAELVSSVPVTQGALTTLVATYDQAGEARLYVNGALAGIATLPPYVPAGIHVGRKSAGGGGGGFLGRVAEVMVYDRPLTPVERIALNASLELAYGTPSPSIQFDALPADAAIHQRDDSDQATVRFAGAVHSAGYDAIEVLVRRDGQFYDAQSQSLSYVSGTAPFAMETNLEAGLHDYDVAVLLVRGVQRTVVAQRQNIACGDVYLIQGQSNAEAADRFHEELANDLDQRFWTRCFGIRGAQTITRDRHWDIAEGEAVAAHGAVGAVALRLARIVQDEVGIPIGIINGAEGGTSITQHLRNDADPTDTDTIYGRLLYRAREAEVDQDVRGLIFYHGEADANVPALWQSGFDELYEDWKTDYPALEQIYVFQIRQGCGVTDLGLREIQRQLPFVYPDIQVMSTTAAPEHDGCHFHYAGYAELGERIARLLLRDFSGSDDVENIDAPDVLEAAWTSPARTGIRLTFRDPDDLLVWEAGSEADILLDDPGVTVLGGSVVGNTVELTLSGPSVATTVGWDGHEGDGPWIRNTRGVGALTFFEVPIVHPCFTPTSYCVAAANSASPGGAQMGWSGSTSLSAGDLVLTASGLPTGKNALFLAGLARQEPPQPLGNGFLCVAPQVVRLKPTIQSDSAGTVSLAVDFTAKPLDTLSPGETRVFQLWYRDPPGGGAGFNLSNGLEVVFCP